VTVYCGLVTRLRLISLLTATLALAGGAAAPIRVVESTRWVVSIVRLDRAREIRSVNVTRATLPVQEAAATIGVPRATRRLSAPVLHPLFQRPPPLTN
jgi:hypothetical protein